MAGGNDDRSAADIIESTVLHISIAASVKIIHGAFNPAAIRIGPVIYAICAGHPGILKGTEPAVKKSHPVIIGLDGKCLRSAMGFYTIGIFKTDIFCIKIMCLYHDHCTVLLSKINFGILLAGIFWIIRICAIDLKCNHHFILILANQIYKRLLLRNPDQSVIPAILNKNFPGTGPVCRRMIYRFLDRRIISRPFRIYNRIINPLLRHGTAYDIRPRQ